MWTEEVFRAMGSVIGRDQMVRGLRHRDCRPFPASFHLHTPLPVGDCPAVAICDYVAICDKFSEAEPTVL